MASVNKAIVLGNVGRDPEVRYTADGAAIANVSVATTYKPKDKPEVTEWHRISAFGRIAEIIGEYVKKGSPLYVEGRLQTRKWTDKDGQERYTTEIVAENIQLLGRKGDGEDAPPAKPAASKPVGTKTRPAAAGDPTGMDDDIPF